MSATLLDGKTLSATLREETRLRVEKLRAETNVQPGLAAVLVGSRDDSRRYVRHKRKACEQCGIKSWLHELPEDVSQEELHQLIVKLNEDAAVHGILVQMPLPKHIDESAIVDAVHPSKDVDGFGPENLGLLAAGRPRFMACTPLGVLQLLQRNDIPTSGAHVAIIGRSTIVGKPLSLILMQKGIDATVTVCHSRTKDIPAITRSADIVIAALGQRRFLKADMVRKGAVVIDVGINQDEKGKLCGDVDFDAVREVASAITPVPGGVGPMTIAMLLHNTVEAALQTSR